MRSRLSMLAVVFVMTVAAPVLTAGAHPGHDHKVMGVILSFDDGYITLKTTDGKELTFAVTPATKFVRAKQPGNAADLKAGMRIVANVGDGEEPLKAKAIEYAAPATDGFR